MRNGATRLFIPERDRERGLVMTDTPILRTMSAAVGAADPASDAELLVRYARAADGTAFELLVRRHAGTVWAVCRAALPGDRHAAEDAFQATFLALARKAGSVRGESAGGWLFRVARNAATRRRASGGREPPVPLTEQGAHAPRSPGCEVERDETAAVVQDEVDRLAAKYRDPVVLCFYEGHSHAEAAARLGWPIGTVASRLARAKDRLRARLVRRGVALGAVVMTAARADAGLIRNTLTTVLGPAGRVPPGVLTLTNGVVSAMRIAQLKVLAAGTAAALVLTAGVFAMHGGHGPGRGRDGGSGGRSAARSEPQGVLGHLHALHDHLYRMWFGASADAPDAAAKKELKALEGTWRIVALEADGKEAPAGELAGTRLTFKGDEMEQREAGRDRVERLKVTLAPGVSPKHFDLTALTGPEQVKGKTCPGIYKRDGDTLTVCGRTFEALDKGRPAEFKGGEGLSLLTLERVKDQKDELAALDGEWQAVTASVSGVEDPAEVVKTISWTVTAEGQGSLTEGGQAVKADFAVDPARAPAHLTMTLTDGPAPERGLALDGIYFRQGDKLFVALADPKTKGAERPKELKPGKGVAYITLERKKK